MAIPHVLLAPHSVRSLQRGIDTLADLLGSTLGPRPASILDLAHERYVPDALEDAPSIARRLVELEDRQADVAAMLLRNLVWQAETRLGDGGATVAVLCQTMFKEALKMAESGVSRTRLAQGLTIAAERVGLAMEQQSRPIGDETELAQVALTATGEPEVAVLIGESLYLMGADAIINVEKYAGRMMDCRYHTPAIFKAPLAHRTQLEQQNVTHLHMPDCLVAAVDGELNASDDMLALLEAALLARRSRLLILARKFSETVLAWFALNHRQSHSPIKAVGVTYEPMPSAADVPYEDLAHLTGAAVLGLLHTRPVSKVRPRDLGHVLSADIDLERTRILPAPDRIPAVRLHALHLRTRLEQLDEGDPSRTWLRRRIAAMDLGCGEIRVGADTEVEINWKKRIVERGLRSAAHALKHGVVPGGGCSFLHAQSALSDVAHCHGEVRLGIVCAARALPAPLLRILKNSRHPAPGIVAEEISNAESPVAFDVNQGRIVDAYEHGLLDASFVNAEAFRMAASGAAMALTIDTIVFRRNPPRMARP